MISFGSKNVASQQQADGSHVMLASINSTDFTEVSDKLVLGGLPLSLAYDGLKYAPIVISEPSASLDPQAEFAQRDVYHALSTLDNSFILPILPTTPDLPPADETILNGIPLALTNENELIVVTTAGLIEEVEEFFWSGMPLSARRIDQNWYLVINEI